MIDEIAKSEVAVNVHFIPMPMLSFFNSLGYDIKNYPQLMTTLREKSLCPYIRNWMKKSWLLLLM